MNKVSNNVLFKSVVIEITDYNIPSDDPLPLTYNSRVIGHVDNLNRKQGKLLADIHIECPKFVADMSKGRTFWPGVVLQKNTEDPDWSKAIIVEVGLYPSCNIDPRIKYLNYADKT